MTAATLAAALSAAVLAATGSAAGAPAAASGPPFTACPAVGASASCGVFIVLNADGSTSLSVDPGSSNPFDGSDGTTIGVLNSSGRTIPSVVLASNLGLFGFDGGGMCSGTFPPPTPTGCPFDNNVSDTGSDYAGPGITFSGISGTPAASGVVNFAASCSGGPSCTPTPGGLTNGSTAFWSLESPPTGASFLLPKATPTLSGHATPGTAGGTLSDQATLVGGASATGSILFSLYANTTCAGTPVATASAGINGDGTYTSGNLPVAAAGTYTWVASYSGDTANNPAATPCGAQTVSVAKATPTLTAAAAPGLAGGKVSNSATLAGGAAPSGAISFSLFANNSCTGPPLATASAKVTGDGTYPSGNLPVPGAGAYTWVVSYSGDDNNGRLTTACGVGPAAVGKATPTLTTAAAPGFAGAKVSNLATLAGGASPTGAISFSLYANTTCTGAPVATASAKVTGDGTYPSGSLPVPAAGTYTWVVTYSGDANNNVVDSPCDTQAVTVGKAKAILSAPPASLAGDRLAGSATLSGGDSPGGTITFRLYANATCTGTPVATASAPVTGDGTYRAGNLPASSPGTYNLVASYSGDANNDSSTTPCGAQTGGLGTAAGVPASGLGITPSTVPNTASGARTQGAGRAVAANGATTSGPLVLLFLLAAVLVVAATVAFALMRARPVLVGTAPPADAGAGVLLGQGLTRSRQALGERIAAIGTRSRLDDEAWEAVEDALIRADVGARATGALLEKLRRQKLTPESVGEALRRQLGVILDRPDRTLQVVKGAASVWLVAGFNGTAHATAGKLAKLLEDQGRRVVVTEAGEHDHAGGAAGTLTDTVANAHGEGIDVVVVDAGGSQDPSAGIAEELREIRRIATDGQAIVSEALFVLDATMGQNGIARARGLSEAVRPTGAVLTNLDGTAGGGIVLAVEEELGIPVKVVGVGGSDRDLAAFDPRAFVEALMGNL